MRIDGRVTETEKSDIKTETTLTLWKAYTGDNKKERVAH